jgi:drug/metabolite transporter (DMT)-like permease
MIHENTRAVASGYLALVVLPLLTLLLGWLFIRSATASQVVPAVLFMLGLVKMALTELKEQDVVDLDEERKANMVSNLLVVLCGEENAQPVLNAGSLYS